MLRVKIHNFCFPFQVLLDKVFKKKLGYTSAQSLTLTDWLLRLLKNDIRQKPVHFFFV